MTLVSGTLIPLGMCYVWGQRVSASIPHLIRVFLNTAWLERSKHCVARPLCQLPLRALEEGALVRWLPVCVCDGKTGAPSEL